MLIFAVIIAAMLSLKKIARSIAELLDNAETSVRCDEIQEYAPSFCHSTTSPHDTYAIARGIKPTPPPFAEQKNYLDYGS